MLRAIIVDDERKSRESLSRMIEEFVGNVEVCALCKDVDEGISAIQEYNPDVVLLDVQLQQETGFDLLGRLSEISFEVIFITAHTEYALQAIKFSAIDYLLKPIHVDDLRTAMAKVERRRQGAVNSTRDEMAGKNSEKISLSKIALPTAEGLMFVRISDILYFRASGSYTEIFMKDHTKVLVSRNLKEYEELLEEHNFFRIHHNCLVQLDYVQKYIRGEGGYVVMVDNTFLDVSRRKKDAFLKRMGHR